MTTTKTAGSVQRAARSGQLLLTLLAASCTLHAARCRLYAADPVSRVFWADARLSAPVAGWSVGETFPVGPLLTKTTPEGSVARIVAMRMPPENPPRVASDVSVEVLQEVALSQARQSGERVLSRNARSLGGRNAYEVTIEHLESGQPVQTQMVFFFMNDRFAWMALRASKDSFPWLVPEFQTWLEQVRFVSRQEQGRLAEPAAGGLWIHETGGVRARLPDTWLIGTADDRQLGAVLAREGRFLTFTLTVGDAGSPAGRPSANDRRDIQRALKKKDFRVTTISEEPFHGLPALQVAYEGHTNRRFVKGHDLWVYSPKGRWLINLEGDSALARERAHDFRDILDAIDFL